MLVDCFDLCVYVEGSHERYGSLLQIFETLGISEFGLPVELARPDLLNFFVAECDRVILKSYFSDLIMSDAVCFVGEDAESMPAPMAYSSFPASILTDQVLLPMDISVSNIFVKFAFDCTQNMRDV